jgi:PilZ domain
MNPGEKRLDRLLRRHPVETGLELIWNPHPEKAGLFKKEEVSSVAIVKNLSLEGALVEVPDDQDHKLREHVTVRLRDIEGQVEIRHCSDGPEGRVLYGVRFLSGDDFKALIERVVGELRGHATELETAWKRRN